MTQPALRTIRVALLAMKPRLRDILSDAVAGQRDMEIIHRPLGLDRALLSAAPDALVLETVDPLDDEIPASLLRALPRSRVLLVCDTGDRAAVYELRASRRVLSNVSMSEVIDTIRFGLRAPDAGGTPTGDDNS
jgi:hypothetical protein